MGELRLEACEFESLTRWRWVLTAPGGSLIADHEVRLDAGCWQFEAFTDLLGYLSWHVAPDRRIEDEARIVAEVGEWIGTEVFGAVASALVKERPATVRVIVPAEPTEAQSLLFRPLELAHVGGKPLSVQDVTLVMQPGGDAGTRGAAPVGNRLRVLGLFSLPEGGQPLNLRRERHALVRLITGIAAGGRAADVRVLQYGVTRDQLRDVLEEDEGWDVIHISGHGAPGELLLETEAGLPDRVTAAELAGVLDLARERVKLVSLSACWSAALTAAKHRRLLGLPIPAATPAEGNGVAGRDGGTDQGDQFTSGALATELAGRLGCAVLAMRYPVTDDFAIALAAKLYDLLARQGRPLPRALGMALAQTIAIPPTAACPALSAGTPALFGARAVDLRLTAPPRTGAESYDTGALKMAGFPPQPDRFVGRTGVMARASAALADASGIPGVLLHGMPGGGKTACALELAYTHEHAFDRLVWFKAPDEGRDITGALTEFALTLERELPDFRMIHVLADEAELSAFLPRLTELAERRRVLIVIDNMESLLSDTGQWRDARWGQVVGALCAHTGLGRVVLTSRRMPSGLAGLRTEVVDALSLDEALLLARELPHLSDLIQGGLHGIDSDAARKLALGVLNLAQGHPKLLELADGQAADPARLGVLVQAGDQAWRETGGVPDGFFATGEPHAAGEDYLHVLAAWTQAVSGGLGAGQRTLFWFLCCLEEADRTRPVAESTWAKLWNRLELTGDPSHLDQTLAVLAAHGLATLQPGTDNTDESYGIHPGVAAAGRAQAGKEFQDVVDTELATFWNTVARDALKREGDDGTTRLVIHAGLAAAPYFLRQEEWNAAASLLQAAFNRSYAQATAAAVLPALRAIAASGQVPWVAGVLAQVLELIDPAAAEHQMRAFLDAALARGDYRSASTAIGYLIGQYRSSGRLTEALTLVEKQGVYTRRAGLGPWTQLSDDVWRLQVLNEMGQAEQVFGEVQRLREHMKSLPAIPDQSETAIPWAVREALLNAGHYAARQLGRWSDALELDAEVIASMRARGAPATEIARSKFNDYYPLIRLGRIDDAMAVLRECRQVFENAHDIPMLGKVLGALADIEDKRGHGDAAISLQRDTLRYMYLGGDVLDIAIGHHNLGYILHRYARQPASALAHHLAAALIFALAGADRVDESARLAAVDLRAVHDDVAAPANVTDLCRQAAEVTGVDLRRLLTSLAPDPDTAEQTLQELTVRVQALAAAPLAALSPHLATWDPVIAAILVADSGNSQAVAALDAELDSFGASADWSALVAALRRLRAGDSRPELLARLDIFDATIVTRALDARDGRAFIPASLWPAMRLGPVLGDLVAGAGGDIEANRRARQVLDAMTKDPEWESLANALSRILDGDRDPELDAQLSDPTHQAIVATVLYHIGSGD